MSSTLHAAGALLTHLSSLRQLLGELESSAASNQGAANALLGSIVDDLGTLERTGASRAAEIDTDVLEHLSLLNGSHPDHLLGTRLSEVAEARRLHDTREAALRQLATRLTIDLSAPQAPPPAAPHYDVRGSIERAGLAAAATRIFDEDGQPLDLSESHIQLLRGAISDGALREVMLGAAEHHSSIAVAAGASLHDRPRTRFTATQLARSFELFIDASSSSSSSTSSLGVANRGGGVPDDLVLDAQTLQEHERAANTEALLPVLQSLIAMSWPSWPYNNGNPFVLKLTLANARKNGVPNYFEVVKEPMDLTRMREKIDRCSYASPVEFLSDATLIVANAKLYNCPETWRKTAPAYFPPPAEVAATRPAEAAAAPVYAAAWDLGARLDAIRPAVLRAWDDTMRRKRAEVLLAVQQHQRQQQGR